MTWKIKIGVGFGISVSLFHIFGGSHDLALCARYCAKIVISQQSIALFCTYAMISNRKRILNQEDRELKRCTENQFYAIFTHIPYSRAACAPSTQRATTFTIWLLKKFVQFRSPFSNFMSCVPTQNVSINTLKTSQKGAIIIRQRNEFKWSLY